MTSFPIPDELVERILTFCRPCDLASFSASCRVAYTLVYDDSYQYLWRELFLAHPFDDPRNSDERSSINWRREMIRRIRAERTASNPNASLDLQTYALQVFMTIIQNAPPGYQGSCPSSDDLRWAEHILRHSYLLKNNLYTSNHTVYSRLRSYLVLLLELQQPRPNLKTLSLRHRNESRHFVYSMQNYMGKRHWGPFTDSGHTDWEHVEHLVNVAVYNLLELPELWRGITPPSRLEATRRGSAPGTIPSGHDWAGVEGTWRRYVFYIDYRDLFAFNYSLFTGGQPDPSFFECPHFREATRLLEINLHLVKRAQLRHSSIEALEHNYSITESRWPTLYYSGIAKGLHGVSGTIEGLVQMGLDGVVRWQFISDYSNHGQWGADGVQVGNIASAMGIVGVWTTPNHDDAGDPLGPFWMWKVEDNSETYLMEHVN